MARPQKAGLDYYNVDTDLMSDPKVKRLCLKYGFNGFGLLQFLWVSIYRDGYFIKVADSFIELVSLEMRVDEKLIAEIINYMVSLNIFDRDIYNNHKILTSNGIQKRYLTIVTRRNEVRIIKEIWITDFPDLLTSKYPKTHIPLLESIVFTDIKDNIIERKPFEKQINEYKRIENLENGKVKKENGKEKKIVNVDNNPVNVDNNPQRKQKTENRKQKTENRNEKTENRKQERNEKNKFFPGEGEDAPAPEKNLIFSPVPESQKAKNKSSPSKEQILTWVSELENVPDGSAEYLAERYYLKRSSTDWKTVKGNRIADLQSDCKAWIHQDIQELKQKNGVLHGKFNSTNGTAVPTESELAEWNRQREELIRNC